jgi:hypothetical protein
LTSATVGASALTFERGFCIVLHLDLEPLPD